MPHCAEDHQGTVAVHFFCIWLSLKTSYFLVTNHNQFLQCSALCSSALASNSQPPPKKNNPMSQKKGPPPWTFFLVLHSELDAKAEEQCANNIDIEERERCSRGFRNFYPTCPKPNGKKTNQWRSMSGWPMSTQPHLMDIIQVCRFCCSPPARWGLLDFIRAVLLLLRLLLHLLLVLLLAVQIPVGTAGPPLRAQDPSGHCRTSTATSMLQWALPDLNRDFQLPDRSGHCRTSTASSRSQWALPDLNGQIECQKICQMECQIDCQKICQIECQKICQIECQKICQIECQKICQIECQKICQIECQKICQNICQIEC